MPIAFSCVYCGKAFEVDDAKAGKKAKCGQCGQQLTVPDRPTSVADTGGRDFDPFGLADAYQVEEKEDAGNPYRSATGETPAKRTLKIGDGPVYWTLTKLPAWGYATYLATVVALLGAAALVTDGERKLALAIVGAFLCVAPFGYSILMRQYGLAFREGFFHGLACVCLPFYSIGFRIAHMDALESWRFPRWTIRGGLLLFISPAFIFPFVRAVEELDRAARRGPGPRERQLMALQDRMANRPHVPPLAVSGGFPRPRIAPPWNPGPGQPPAVADAPRQPPLARRAPAPQPSPESPRIQPAPAPQPAAPPKILTPYEQHEEFARRRLARVDEMTGVLASMKDLAGARAAVPRFEVLAREVANEPLFFDHLPKLPAGDVQKIVAQFADSMSEATARYAEQVKRVNRIGDIRTVFSYEVLARQPFLVGGYSSSTPAPGTDATPHFQGLAPIPTPVPTVTVNITGAGPWMRAAIDREMDAILKLQATGTFRGYGSTQRGDRMIYSLSPVNDAQAVADRITFGKVTRVSGTTIDVVAHPSAPEPMGPTEAGRLAPVLAGLGAPDAGARKDALRRLRGMAPTGRRDEVAAAVRPLLNDPDGFTRADAIRVLGTWGGPDDVPALVARLKDPPGFGVRLALFETLRELNDPRAAAPLAEFLADPDRFRVVPLLKGLGPAAEAAVLPYLTHRDPEARKAAADVLKEIGTDKSVDGLRTLAEGGDDPDRSAARDALKALADRGVQ